MTEESYYMVEGEQALILLGELRETQDISSHFLKACIAATEVANWESSAIPELADLYSGSRACGALLRSMMETPIPPEFRDKVVGQGFCISATQYIEFVAMVESLRQLKRKASVNNNISFEVH